MAPRLALVVPLTLALLYAPRDARANGRFPKAQAIAVAPGSNGESIVMCATFGVLTTHDGGQSWRWICEQSLGYVSAWDPPIAVTRDGRLWIALANGLRSTMDGCAMRPAPSLEGELVADVAVDATGIASSP